MSIKSLDGVLTKKAHLRESFNEQQIEDLKNCMDEATVYLHIEKNFCITAQAAAGAAGGNAGGTNLRLISVS